MNTKEGNYKKVKETATKETIDHYKRCEKAILALCKHGDCSCSLIGDNWRWYKINWSEKKAQLWLPNEENYDFLTRKHRTLYGTLQLWTPEIATETRTWIQKTNGKWGIDKLKEGPLGTRKDTRLMTLSVDIDRAKDKEVTDPNVKKWLEAALKLFADYFKTIDFQSYALFFSGGGGYVMVHPLVTAIGEEEEHDIVYRWEMVQMCFDFFISEMEKRFFEKYPEAKEYVKGFDCLNYDAKRQFKMPLSIHLTKPFAVIPLDKENPAIDFEKARLPIADKVIEEAANCLRFYDGDVERLGKHIIEEYADKAKEEIGKHHPLNRSFKAVPDDKELDVDSWAPCARNMYNESKITGKGTTRRLGFLANYMQFVGVPREKAYNIFLKKAAEWNAETSNIFEQWYDGDGEPECWLPTCEKFNQEAKGYPRMSFGGMGLCTPDDRCKQIKKPLDYHKKKKKKPKKTPLREQQISDTAEIMDVLKQRYHFITAKDTKTIYHYKDGVFEEADTLIEAEVEAHFNDTNSTYFTNEIINHLHRETYTNRDMFNADKTHIPLINGLFNLETFALEPFDETKIFTFRVPIVYDVNAGCPNIKAWIKEIVNPDSLNLLQEFCGYGFEPRLPLHKTLWLHGSGRNGKGAFMRLYKKAIGRQNGSTIPLEQMSAKFRFVLIRLLDKLVNVCSEPQSNYVFQTETFKKITGGDEIEGEIKGLQKTVSFTSFAKLFIMGNKYPNIDDNTIGFWERMEIVGFPNDYSENFIPDIEDKKISADGGEEQALAGFFNWCMVGLKRLKEKNYKLSQSKSSEETRLEFEKVSNSIRAFITECVDLKPSEKYPKPALWNDYKDYCDRFDLQIQQKSIFTGRIGELRSVTLKPAKKDGKTQKFWFGLTFKGCEEDESAEEGEKVKDKKGLSKLSKLPDFNTPHGEDKNIKKIEENIDNNIIGGYIQKPTTSATSATSTKEKPTPIEIKKFTIGTSKCKECGNKEIDLIYVVFYSNGEFKYVCEDCGEQIMHDCDMKLSGGG